MEVTILHVSDLHRDRAQEVTNDALLDSLTSDMERYVAEDPPIRRPDLIIVSGDIVRGVHPSVANWPDELQRQYDQAQDFLLKLADAFVGGKRQRVVLIPGNHDVSYPQSMASMRKVAIAGKQRGELIRQCVRGLFSPGTSFRWSWETLEFYEVNDNTQYRERLAGFSKFYGAFYQGGRQYSSDPAEQFDLFDYPELNLTVATFNSCFNNDPLNKQGAIHPDCIARAAQTLRGRTYRGRLLLAVWHHNTSGGPSSFDYMDADTLQVLIDSGFSLGFHGHQHKAQFIDERFEFGGDRKITVVSAGTLCGGPTSLPSGHARAYNLLTLDLANWRGRLHQRAMLNEGFGRPIWGPGRFPSSGKSFVDFDLQRPPARDNAAETVRDLGEAEQLLATRKFADAVAILQPLAATVPLARRLLLECLSNQDDPASIVRHFYPPQSVTEILYVADALWTTQDRQRLGELLDQPLVRDHGDPSVAQMRTKYRERLIR
jgi:hypothetical protein